MSSSPSAPITPAVGLGKSILAIDYGRRRMGLALSDELGITARPLEVCIRTNRRADIARLRQICRENKVGTIVVGCPLHLDGSASEMSEEASRFAERLRRNLGLPVHLVDERLSSWEARQTLEETTPRQGRKDLDDIAAAVILRDYLSQSRRAEQG